ESAADDAAEFGARFSVVLRVVVAHLVTMGPGEYIAAPSYDWLFVFSTLQQFGGIFCNVFLVTKRDGKLVLLIRVGNLRCNVIQRPEVELQLFTSVLTKEGESRVASQELKARTMPLMYSQCVVEHVIDEDSPLLPFLEEHDDEAFTLLSKNELCICVLFRGFDLTYYEDVWSNYKYTPADVVLSRDGACIWSDMIDATANEQLADDDGAETDDVGRTGAQALPDVFAPTRRRLADRKPTALNRAAALLQKGVGTLSSQRDGRPTIDFNKIGRVVQAKKRHRWDQRGDEYVVGDIADCPDNYGGLRSASFASHFTACERKRVLREVEKRKIGHPL
ncbi:unnamed protein product, partial [Amoebophrya sp. A25]